MEKDPILELREIRKKLDRKYHKDPTLFRESIKKIELLNKKRLVVGKPKFKKQKAA